MKDKELRDLLTRADILHSKPDGSTVANQSIARMTASVSAEFMFVRAEMGSLRDALAAAQLNSASTRSRLYTRIDELNELAERIERAHWQLLDSFEMLMRHLGLEITSGKRIEQVKP
jgi:hypothetical protein